MSNTFAWAGKAEKVTAVVNSIPKTSNSGIKEYTTKGIVIDPKNVELKSKELSHIIFEHQVCVNVRCKRVHQHEEQTHVTYFCNTKSVSWCVLNEFISTRGTSALQRALRCSTCSTARSRNVSPSRTVMTLLGLGTGYGTHSHDAFRNTIGYVLHTDLVITCTLKHVSFAVEGKRTHTTHTRTHTHVLNIPMYKHANILNDLPCRRIQSKTHPLHPMDVPKPPFSFNTASLPTASDMSSGGLGSSDLCSIWSMNQPRTLQYVASRKIWITKFGMKENTLLMAKYVNGFNPLCYVRPDFCFPRAAK